MTISEYVSHYLKTKETAIFFGLTLGLLLVILAIVYGYTVMHASGMDGRGRKSHIRREFESLADRFFELLFSGGTILFFMAAYYLINRFFFVEPYRTIWDNYRDFLLLLIIVISILVNRILDNVLIRLRAISHEEKASIRLVGMLYMMLIFGYIKFVYENDNYDMFITYFLGLMIGRFVYFDVSWQDLKNGIGGAISNLPILVLALAYLSGLAWYGFKTAFLIKHIGVVTNVFFIHLFMFAAIAVVFYIYRIIRLIRR